MKFFTKKSTIQKIILALVIVILFNFTIPVRVQAADAWEKFGGKILKELFKLLDSLGDVIMGGLSKAMVGTHNMYNSVMLDTSDIESWLTINNEDGALYSNGTEDMENRIKIDASEFSSGLFGDLKYPNMLYCPENLFANKIAAFDVNFIHPNTYTNAYGGDAESYAHKLAPTIASWYKAFRNISVVGLLCVLVYLGIRILIETSAQGKAQYKEALKNWFVALCLVFAIHFIMAGTLMIIDKVTELLSESLGTSQIYIDVSGDSKVKHFKTNLTGYVRLMAESNNIGDSVAYSIVYIVLVIYTLMFTLTYFKRFLWMAFLTMIAPLVSLTYPIDKAGDGKAQAFNMWIKEYIMNAILQPVHLLLYSVMVSSAVGLAAENPIYALVTIGFLIPAEKFIKKMFGLDKGETAGGFGSFAGGAMAMKALDGLGKKAPPPLQKGKPGEGKQQASEEGNYKIRQNKRNSLENFNGEGNTLGIQSADETAAALAGNATNKVTEDDSIDYSNVDKSLDDKVEKQNMDTMNDLSNSTEESEQSMNYFGKDKGSSNNSTNNANSSNILNKKRNIGGPRKSVARALGGTAIKGFKRNVRGAPFVAKKGLRTILKGAGSMMGAGIGLAAGIASGDPSKALQYAVAGSAAGNKIGEGVFNGAGYGARMVQNGARAIGNEVNNVRNDYNVERYGYAQARRRQIDKTNTKAKNAFMKDDEEIAKYEEIAAKLEEKNGKSYSVENLMDAAFDYKVAGLDDKQIETGLKLESKYGEIGGAGHQKMMDIVDFAGNHTKADMLDNDSRASMEKEVASLVSNKAQQVEVMNLVAESYGLGKFYKNVSSNTPKQQVKTPKKQKK